MLQCNQTSKEGTGTAKAFDPNIKEFYQFCEYLYPNSLTKYHLDYDKVYKFMFYQAFRDKKKGGSNKQKQEGVYFEIDVYKTVMKGFTASPGGEIVEEDFPEPNNPIAICTFN